MVHLGTTSPRTQTPATTTPPTQPHTLSYLLNNPQTPSQPARHSDRTKDPVSFQALAQRTKSAALLMIRQEEMQKEFKMLKRNTASNDD
jgi:hypothetical protein